MEISSKDWWESEQKGVKHLPGKHDQMSHGGGGAPRFAHEGKEDIGEVILKYQNGAYQSINGYLRGEDIKEDVVDKVKQDIEILDKNMSLSTNDKYLFRGDGAGISSTLFDMIPNLPHDASLDDVLFGGKIEGKSYNDFFTEKLKGVEFTDKAFLSSSSSQSVAMDKFVYGATSFSKFGASGLVQIFAPKNTKMLDVEKVSMMGAKEREFILARGTKLRVDKVSFEPLQHEGTETRFYIKWQVTVVPESIEKKEYSVKKLSSNKNQNRFIWDKDSIIIDKIKKFLSPSTIFKGGPGSGNWEGPGDPRYAREGGGDIFNWTNETVEKIFNVIKRETPPEQEGSGGLSNNYFRNHINWGMYTNIASMSGTSKDAVIEAIFPTTTNAFNNTYAGTHVVESVAKVFELERSPYDIESVERTKKDSSWADKKYVRDEVKDQGWTTLARVVSDKDMDAIVKASYEYTQKLLKDNGIESITVYRGMNKKRSAKKGNVLESWTAEKNIAERFAESRYAGKVTDKGIVETKTIPAKNIFAVPGSGWGFGGHMEVIVLNDVTHIKGFDDKYYSEVMSWERWLKEGVNKEDYTQPKKSLGLSTIFKGGPGSGNWEGPGDPRYAREDTVRNNEKEQSDNIANWAAESAAKGEDRVSVWDSQGIRDAFDYGYINDPKDAELTVYHGQKQGFEQREGYLFVTLSKSGAEFHGDVSEYKLKPGAKIYPDLSEYDQDISGLESLFSYRGSSSAIIHTSDLERVDKKKSISLSSIFKGGVGSGIRGHRTLRQATSKLTPEQQATALAKLKEEQLGLTKNNEKWNDVSSQMVKNLKEIADGTAKHKPIEGKTDTSHIKTIISNMRNEADLYTKYLASDTAVKLRDFTSTFENILHEGIRNGEFKNLNSKDLDAFGIDSVKKMVHQEVESNRQQFTDHGIRHVYGNIDRQLEIMDSMSDKVPVKDKLAAMAIMVNHDMGYTTKDVRVGGVEGVKASSGHKDNSFEMYNSQKSTWNENKLFTPKEFDRVTNAIKTHDSSEMSSDNLLTSTRISDNLALFAKEKLPSMFKYVDGGKDYLMKMGIAAKKGNTKDFESLRDGLYRTIDASGLNVNLKRDLKAGTREISLMTPKFSMGVLAGEISDISGDKAGKVNVTVKYSAYDSFLQNHFDMGQKQTKKLLGDYGITDFSKTDYNIGDRLSVKVEGYSVVKKEYGLEKITKHLPGKHDQMSHGRGGIVEDDVYHGSSSQFVDTILKEGMKAGPGQFAGGIHSVYASESKITALQYSEMKTTAGEYEYAVITLNSKPFSIHVNDDRLSKESSFGPEYIKHIELYSREKVREILDQINNGIPEKEVIWSKPDKILYPSNANKKLDKKEFYLMVVIEKSEKYEGGEKEYGLERVLKHLPGQHDQQTHGHGGGGGKKLSGLVNRIRNLQLMEMDTDNPKYQEKINAILDEIGASENNDLNRVYKEDIPFVLEAIARMPKLDEGLNAKWETFTADDMKNELRLLEERDGEPEGSYSRRAAAITTHEGDGFSSVKLHTLSDNEWISGLDLPETMHNKAGVMVAVAAHEYVHVMDTYNKYSGTSKWQESWEESGKVSGYARQSAKEGFAESVALMGIRPAYFQKKYPELYNSISDLTNWNPAGNEKKSLNEHESIFTELPKWTIVQIDKNKQLLLLELKKKKEYGLGRIFKHRNHPAMGPKGDGERDSSSQSLIPGQEIKVAQVDKKYDYSNNGRTELGDKKLGKCFDTAGRFALNNYSEGDLIHGTINIGEVKIAHAWIELPGNVVFDGTQTQFFDKSDYYKVTKAIPEHRYTFDKAREFMMDEGYFGPWESTTGLLKNDTRRKSVDEVDERLSSGDVKLSEEELNLLHKKKEPK